MRYSPGLHLTFSTGFRVPWEPAASSDCLNPVSTPPPSSGQLTFRTQSRPLLRKPFLTINLPPSICVGLGSVRPYNAPVPPHFTVSQILPGFISSQSEILESSACDLVILSLCWHTAGVQIPANEQMSTLDSFEGPVFTEKPPLPPKGHALLPAGGGSLGALF